MSTAAAPYAGCVAVVTGGASGIGAALAAGLHRRGAARVVVADLDEDAAAGVARTIGPAAIACALDVADEDAVAARAAWVQTEVGPVDCWFSNAGVNPGAGLGGAADWRRALEVNLLAHVHAARHVLPRMEARGRGCFVVTASAAGLLSDVRAAPYSASKHAAVAFAEWLSINTEPPVTISCVCPEVVQTAMTRASSRALSPEGAISATEAADRTLDGVARGDFLVLTHPRTAEFALGRVQDRARWLGGMRRLRARLDRRTEPVV